MKTYLKIAIVSLILSLLVACSPRIPSSASTPSAVPTTQVPPTTTLELPTTTPTEPPVVNPIDYLLQTGDLPKEFEYGPYRLVEEIIGTGHNYSISYWNSSGYSLENTLTVFSSSLTKIPDELGQDEEPIETPLIGQFTRAYKNSSGRYEMTIVFVKDRALVTISIQGFNFETLIELGNLMASRLPEITPEPQPISFAEELDDNLFKKYFVGIQLGNANPDDLIASTGNILFLQKKETPCLIIKGVQSARDYTNPSYAVYDLKSNIYIYRWVGFFGFHEGPWDNCFFVREPGSYEFRVSVNDTLISTVPFEIQ